MTATNKEQITNSQTGDRTILKQIGSSPSVTVDYDRYAHMLEDADLTETQKQEFLQALWNIVVAIIDLGFRVDPVCQAQENDCGKTAETDSECGFADNNMIKFEDTNLTNNFNKKAE